ncbi:MAG: hypothetical protein JWN89_559 [Parcubacteria group bacterium]|nr:hypothetical protein [Parcubacteria group bacterium]
MSAVSHEKVDGLGVIDSKNLALVRDLLGDEACRDHLMHLDAYLQSRTISRNALLVRYTDYNRALNNRLLELQISGQSAEVLDPLVLRAMAEHISGFVVK